MYRSPEWKYISEDQRKELGLVFNDDGEFWSVQRVFYEIIKSFGGSSDCLVNNGVTSILVEHMGENSNFHTSYFFVIDCKA